jgi:hypothetical protein
MIGDWRDFVGLRKEAEREAGCAGFWTILYPKELAYYAKFSVVLGCWSRGQCGHTPGGHPHLDPAGRGGHGGPDPLRCTLWVRAATSNADTVSGIRCLFAPGSGMGKKSRSGSGMIISESLETIFG